MQQIIEKTVNRSAGIMAKLQFQRQQHQRPPYRSQSRHSLAINPAPAAKTSRESLRLPTFLPPRRRYRRTPHPLPPIPVESAAASGSITIKALLLITKEAALEISNLEDDANVAELGVGSLISLIVAEGIRTELNIKVGGSLFLNYPTMGDLRK